MSRRKGPNLSPGWSPHRDFDLKGRSRFDLVDVPEEEDDDEPLVIRDHFDLSDLLGDDRIRHEMGDMD